MLEHAEQSGLRERQVVEFFERWGESFPAFCHSFELLADDCVWDQRPVPRLIGAKGAVRFLTVARRTVGLETCEVEVLRVATTGDVVIVERIDRLRRADGSLIAAAPAVGVFTFSGDQVTFWRDYFDSAEFGGQVLFSTLCHGVRSLGRALRTLTR